MELQGLHGQVVDRIGESLAADEQRAGRVLRLEDIQTHYGVSRTVAREAVRVLESKRVVHSRPRIGITVRPLTQWNLYDPQVIRWRLATTQRRPQLSELAELRAAVEPQAAHLAAIRGEEALKTQLLGHATAMAEAAQDNNMKRFIAADAAFHRTLLNTSGNAMFVQLAEVTEELLIARGELHLMPDTIDADSLERHVAAARAIAVGQAADAARCVQEIVERSRDEVERLLNQEPNEDD
ncbi:FadR/GntR family transcriptional regulator [Streptomyces sp. NPDC020801]|uniref:FadR/GntR family transcriptional regulator n=1 Tax=unclassified Streptomyces TaxID=2593676 RepID=UPI0037B81553